MSMLLRLVILAAATLALVVAGWALLAATQNQAGDVFYVAPDGSDSNDGSLNQPWYTVAHALGRLSAGDTLYLRGGIYYEHEIKVMASGTISAPITIQSYPGERAAIDGGVSYFRMMPGTEWEVVDEAIGLYRSRRTFDESFVRGWLIDEDIQLVEYESAENLESTNYGPLDGFAPFYMGPGLQLREDGHIYIRLQYNPNDLTDVDGNSTNPTPVNTDPNNNSLAIFFSRYIFRLDGASYIHFRDIDFNHAVYILDARDGARGIILDGCRMNYGSRALVLRENIQDWQIDNCEFNNGAPEYVYWTDVKNHDSEVAEAYPEFQSAAIAGTMPGFSIQNSLFRDSFDGVTVGEETTNARILGNNFVSLRDDAINLSRGIGDVEVAHNMMWRVRSGISNLSSDATPGHIYIHHNVIDNSAYQRGGRPGNYREENWPVWSIGTPFPDHNEGNKASWWKLYNNTIVSRQNVGHQWAAAGPDSVSGNPEKYVFNNIFFMMDERVIFRDDHIGFGSHYDGNVFFRTPVIVLPLFTNFGDGGRYDSLLAFQENSGTGWEANGLETDPDFDLAAINDANFDATTIWQRYTPRNAQLFTLGASYEGLGWPETQGVNYRGAVPPPEQPQRTPNVN